MNHLFTRIAGPVLAFGLFISCSTLKSPKQSPSDDLSEQQIRQRIDSLDRQLGNQPQKPELLFEKGKLLTELAQKRDDPSHRVPAYTNARSTLTQAEELFEELSSKDSEKVNDLLKVTWSIEHNQGVKTLREDTAGNPDYARAAAHFNNATIVIPDSAISYKMQARAYYKNQQSQKAINLLEKARLNVKDIPALLLEQLAFLYLENDNPRKAVEIYEQAESFSDQNLNLLHGLSNAYINSGNHREAVNLLQKLVRSKPENIIYGQTLATELYFIAAQEMDTIASSLQKGKQIDETGFNSADSLLDLAENQFSRLLNKNSENQDLRLSGANFYYNSASKYQQLLPFVENENKARLEKKIKEYLSASIPLFEQLAEKSPGEKNIWHNLYQAYSYLGMKTEAQKAKSNL